MEPESHTSDENEGLAGDAAERAAPSPRAAEPGEAAGHLTSRPPSNPISFGGEDYLTLSLYVRHEQFAELRGRLDACRQAAEERQEGGDEIALAGQQFVVLPYGCKVGVKMGKAYFRWQLKSETGYILQLMNRPSFEGTMPNGKLTAASLALMRLGIGNLVELAFAALGALGATVVRNKVSRVDVCCDLPGGKIEPLKAAFVAGHYVSRADACDEYGRSEEIVESDYSIYWMNSEATSINLGRSNVRMRIYEKVKECQHDLEKLQTMVDRRWGYYPFRAIRAEFQLRREKLKQLGVDSLADWIAKRATIVRYLTHEWFRLTDGPFELKHPDRTPILPQWKQVQEAFDAWTGNGPPVQLGPIPTQPMPGDHYIKSIVGSFKSLFAVAGVDVDSNETFWNEAMYRLLDEIENRDMTAEVRRRVLEFGTALAKEESC